VQHTLRIFATALACAPWISHAQTEERNIKPIVASLLLDSSAITLTNHFEVSTAPTTLELAIQSLEKQIDQKRADDAVRSTLEPFWQASFWKYIPIGRMAAGGASGVIPSPIVKQDDPFFLPEYLKVSARQLDREMAASEKRSQLLFGR
jgi:hypothetical protein